MNWHRYKLSTARRFLLGIGVAFVAVGSATHAEEPSPALEIHIKAAFLCSFPKFVDWPTTAFASTNAPFVIGVLDDEPMAQALEQTARGKSIGGRPIQVQRIADPARLDPCHILFVERSKTSQFARARRVLDRANVLFVGESPGFLAAGGAINFTNDEERVRFEINTQASERAGLKISSKLLRLAVSVTPPPKREP